MRTKLLIVLAFVPFLLILSCASRPVEWPGPVKGGFRLPNRWILTPAGEHIPVGDLPLNMALSPDGSLLAVTNNGYSRQFISLIDVRGDSIAGEIPLSKSFYGLAFSPDGKRLYASGGGDDRILAWRMNGRSATPDSSISLRAPGAPPKPFPAGIALSPDGGTLYAAENRGDHLAVVSPNSGKVERHIPVGPFPYDVKVVSSRSKIYVSLWGGSAVRVLDSRTNEVTATVRVGDHPNAMLVSRDESLLYVACANTDDIRVIDTARDTLVESIRLHPYPGAPFGSTPNALTLSTDGATLYVANATNNDVAVVDVSQRGKSMVRGLIPVGWYPTALLLSPDGRKLYVANAKGLVSKPNPRGPNPVAGQRGEEYIGGLFNGSVSVIPVPDSRRLSEYTRQTVRNNGFNEAARKMTEKRREIKPAPVPRRVGEPSLIKHVIYVIKENRTYDQVFGDIARGNGDSTICILGRTITPNHHALAEEFVLLDNFYVDAEVSADGHEWSTAAIATDFVEKSWPASYSGRGLPYPSEGSFPIAFPTNGYIWEAAARKGKTYRSYGEFVSLENGKPVAKHPALEGHYDPLFRPWDLAYPDTLRAMEFIRELKEFERTGEMPEFTILRLPNDHTNGTSPGIATPRAMVAENDLALGMLVEAVSRSRFWKETAIFVIEDDAQNGSDHVDAHRTVALAISPYIRRGYADHTLYDTASMLRTMELILGLEPLSQYDAAAYPMVECFTDRANLTPYTTIRPLIPLDEVNSKTAWGARESLAMDFTREDATPEIPLNVIIWKSIRGERSEMPPPVHHRSSPVEDDEDEEGDE
ncbi:MAG: beta-propeller fold lactonase family protein [Candidatus Latescibacterota bacterium]